MKMVSKILAAVVFLCLTFLVLSPLGAGLGEDIGMLVTLGGGALVALVVLITPKGRRAWGSGFLLDGALFLSLPLLIIPLLGRAYEATVETGTINASTSEAAATSIGADLGTAAAFGAFSIIGIVFGIVFLVFGAVLSLGGRREVIVVERSASN